MPPTMLELHWRYSGIRSMAEILLEDATADGPGTAVPLTYGQPREFQHRTVFLAGTFGGAAITLEALDAENNWGAIEDGVFSSPTVVNLSVRCTSLRAVVSGAGETTSVTVTMV